MVSQKLRIAVIGGGFSGLIWAERILRQGHEVVIFEKKDKIGGVWQTLANQSSRVQMVKEDYGFSLEPSNQFGKILPNFTPRDNILQEAESFFNESQLSRHTCLGAEVTSIEKIKNKYIVHYEKSSEAQSDVFDAVTVLPGTLTTPNNPVFKGEDIFSGKLGFGISDDLNETEFKNKNVVIIGMGSYAIENARTALEKGAKHVTIIARSYNIVAPQFMSYLIGSHINWKGIQIEKTLKRVYSAINREDLLEKLKNGNTHAQNTIPPISDIYFIAQKFEKLTVLKGTIKEIYSDGILLENGQAISADIILKCCGFDRSTTHQKFQKLLGKYVLNGMFINDSNRLAFNFEPIHGGFDIEKGIPLASHLTITRLLADFFVYYLEHPEKYEEMKNRLPVTKDASNFSGKHYFDMIEAFSRDNSQIKSIILYHLSCKVARSRNHGSEAEFIVENKKNWEYYCKVCQGSMEEFPYPYRPKLKTLNNLKNYFISIYSKFLYRKVFPSLFTS